jgi:hypothetical protein
MAAAAARILALTVAGVVIFAAVGVAACTAFGAPAFAEATSPGQQLLPFIGVGGSMAFAAAMAFMVTVASRSVVFGVAIGTLTQPLLAAIRFKETAAWIPYLHLENLQSRLLSGRASPFLLQIYEFDMSARASAAIVAGELLVIVAVAYLVFRRQEIVY